MPTLRIDDREVTVERGTTVLRAAQALGIEIPTFCYHPGLTIAANCRMCLVEVKGARKPMPACHATVSDGMEVTTQSESVKRTQRAVLEFILLNHPVDCPICDQAGECVLQDHYRDYSRTPSRLFTHKVHKAKAKPLGPTIMLDAERCILCTRCVRFTHEITKTGELDVMNRGEHSEITTFPGKTLDNPYSLNVVDICPVGALTSKDFRFRRRVWLLEGTRSVCTECSRGCNLRIDAHKSEVERVVPAFNPKVNDWWLCDHGRLSFGTERAPRVTEVSDRTGEGIDTAREAADAMATELRDAAGRSAIVLTPALTVEEAWVAVRLARAVGARLFLGGRTETGDSDALLVRADKNPNRKGVLLVCGDSPPEPLSRFVQAASKGEIAAALVFGAEHAWPDGWEAALGKIRRLGVIGEIHTPLTDRAHLVLPGAPPTMRTGVLVNELGRAQLLRRAVRLDPAGVVYPPWRIAKRMLATLGDPLDFKTEADLFAAVAAAVPAFGGMDHDAIGDYGLPVGEGGEPDLDVEVERQRIDHCAPEWRHGNVSSRLPWQH
jgi:NADH-quinone oxidoreductase subunit G